MKKYLLLLIAIFIITITYSQTEKGKLIIDGQFNIYGHSNSDFNILSATDSNSFRFQIIPNFGYFIKDNFAIGVSLNIGVSNGMRFIEIPNQSPYNTTINSTAKSNSISYGGGGFVRHYKKIVGNLLFSLNGLASYTYQTTKLDYSNNIPNYHYSASDPAHQEIQANTFFVGISPGLIYFMTPKLGIETTFSSIYYSNSSSKNISLLDGNHKNANNYGFNLNITTFYFGFNYNF